MKYLYQQTIGFTKLSYVLFLTIKQPRQCAVWIRKKLHILNNTISKRLQLLPHGATSKNNERKC